MSDIFKQLETAQAGDPTGDSVSFWGGALATVQALKRSGLLDKQTARKLENQITEKLGG